MHFYKMVRLALEERYGLTADHESYGYQVGSNSPALDLAVLLSSQCANYAWGFYDGYISENY